MADTGTYPPTGTMVNRSQFRRSKAIQRQTGRTFHVATRFLPERVREPTYVLYAFFRIADQVVDDPNPPPPAVQRETLERIRAAALGERNTAEPVLSAFSSIRERVGIPDQEINAFIEAMLADVEKERYRSFAELEGYLRGSAVAVAYMMLEVIDPPRKERARPHAKALGEAFQLTNFIRDVGEDIRDYGRIYLPQTTLDRHGVEARTIERCEATPGFARAIGEELARAETKYRKGVAGIRYLPADCQFPVLLAAVFYAEYHAKIKELRGDVLSQTPTLGRLDYLRLAVKTVWWWFRLDDPELVFYQVSPIPYRSTTVQYSGHDGGTARSDDRADQPVIPRGQR